MKDLNTHVEEKAESENKSKSYLENDIMAKVENMLASKNCVLLWGKPGCGKSASLNYIAMYLQNKFEYKYVHCRDPSDICKQQYETEKSLFSIKEAAMFEALAVYFGDELQQVFIEYADPEIITQHCILKTCSTIAEHEMFFVEVNEENEKLFFHRIGKLILSGNIRIVFSGRQMKLPLYQQKLANYFEQLGSDSVKQISRSKCKFENETTFTLAGRYECASLLKLFFECDDNLNQESYDHFKSACESNNIPFVKLLLRKGIDINNHTSDGCTFLHIAIKNGFWRLISILICENADVNCTDTRGNTALIEACKKEDEAVISLLLISGADINKSNLDCQTPLMIATSKGKNRIVDVLIMNEADVNIVDAFGCSCLMHSIKSEQQNIGIIKTLLEAGVDLNIASVDGNTALLIAIQEQQTDIVNILTSYVTKARSERHADTIRNTSTVDITNKCNNLKVTPLICACELRNSEFDVVEDLLFMGAIVNCSDHKDRTPLIVALENNDNDLVDILVKHGANFNFPGDKRTTPLHEMCKINHFNNVQLLISKGSNFEIVDRNSMTPLMIASKYGHIDITQVLIKAGANINSVDLNGMTSLMLACMGGFNNMINVLIENGADINRSDHNDWTPLLAYANSQHDNPEIINFLIKKGANSNALTKDKVSSLMMASFRGHLNIVKQLIKLRMDVNHPDVYGKTAIFSACLSGNVDIVRTLIDNGADTLVSDKNGDTVFTFAKKNKLSAIVDFLSSFSEV
ncbi:ankyrin repeat domain-containing protein 50-like [Mytilus trossulus]|uniref:ankyrin repeat domain-containing protein 50-like n=1 Tax=Mytilus trossulus TaxID=6551 RepID=UPI003003F74F